ncbi:BglG family transcription antiterminator [Lactococcus fujiensis]|uniref:Uncharacterized protein n=1 Tax=Lactococcus fujiensis JCM 16395 TaxID=1291764 RepID=A0A2A5RQ18_9LACT|nr:HTH domain-containing protein [Lactococcus fujiensis]PCS01516.1 hypothetical protein RT41_GL000280 [Lactococcus fujiensis JCM 16395]
MKTNLTVRQIEIAKFLLNNSKYVTSSLLSQEFDVSVRTIKNEMRLISDWAVEQGEQITSQRGKGYRFLTEKLPKEELIQILNSEVRQNSPLDHKMRAKQMIIDFFSSSGPLTSNYFADKFLVSQNTIVNDLVILKKELKKQGLELDSSHWGYSLSGSELKIRNLVSDLLEAEFTNFDLSALLNHHEFKKNFNQVLSVFNNESLSEIYRVIIPQITRRLPEIQENENYLSLSLVIRICLSCQRLKNYCSVGTTPVHEKVEETIVSSILNDIYDLFGLAKFEEEFNYILSEQKLSTKINARILTKKVIQQVSEEMNENFDEDSLLFQNLYTHFSMRFSKDHLYLNEYNPFEIDIKSKNDQLFREIKIALDNNLPDEIRFDDSFIAYVALHFLTSIERKNQLGRKINVLYVCSTGVGVSSFIEQKISKEVDHIRIIGFASVLNSRKYIDLLNPDLVISIFPINNVTTPVIEVKTFLSEIDLQRIQSQVNFLLDAGLGSVERSNEMNTGTSKALVCEQSRDVLIKGYMVYEAFINQFEKMISEDFKESILLHILLMTHRIMFNQQYQDIIEDLERTKLKNIIKSLCNDNELEINDSEIIALMRYLE